MKVMRRYFKISAFINFHYREFMVQHLYWWKSPPPPHHYLPHPNLFGLRQFQFFSLFCNFYITHQESRKILFHQKWHSGRNESVQQSINYILSAMVLFDIWCFLVEILLEWYLDSVKLSTVLDCQQNLILQLK